MGDKLPRPAFPAQIFDAGGSMTAETLETRKKPGMINDHIDPAKWPWWAIVLVLMGILFGIAVIVNPKYNEAFAYLLGGVTVTLRVTVSAYFLATLIGLLVGLARVSKNPIIYNAATLYVEVIRGIPMIVLILYFAYAFIPLVVDGIHWLGGLGLAIAPTSGFFMGLATLSIRSIPAEVRGILALAVGYGAFEAEVFRAGIQSIGKGQMEAAKSLGMTYLQAMRFVILPQAIRRVLPPLGNDFIALLKDSALLTVLAINELTQLSRLRRASTFQIIETFNVVAFMYLSMTLILSAVVRWLEKKMRIEE
jgi:polar amino acid transport system permease protein